jgi:hypothetical protein
MPKSHAKSPERLVQTHLSEAARLGVQALADLEADGSMAHWLRKLVAKELWAKRAKLRKKRVSLVHKTEILEDVRIRIDFHTSLGKEVCESMEALASLEGESLTGWLRGVILREIHRQRRRLEVVRSMNGAST